MFRTPPSTQVITRVVGEPSPGTVVQIECTLADAVLPQPIRLGFDANGRPTVAAGDTEGWQIIPAPTGSGWGFRSHSFPAAKHVHAHGDRDRRRDRSGLDVQ